MKRMDAGGYAACFNHEQLALMCANSDRTIDRLGAENKQLKAENKDLREFALDMVLNIGGCALHGNPLRLREFMARARELGIEAHVKEDE